MKKIFICSFILTIFLFSFVSSLKLGISPAYMDLSGEINEKICKNVSINSDREINVTIEDKWFYGQTQSRNLKDYNLSAEGIGIKFFGDEKVSINQTDRLEICFLAEKTGDYYGIILFSSENNFATIGSWVKLEISGNKINSSPLILTGSAIKGIFSKPDNLVLISSIFVTLISLLFLSKILRNTDIKK